MIGGHLSFSNNQCIIYTTAEIVLLEHIDTIYTRKIDNTYGYEELFIIWYLFSSELYDHYESITKNYSSLKIENISNTI